MKDLIKVKFNNKEFIVKKEEQKYANYYNIYDNNGFSTYETIKVYKNSGEIWYINSNVCLIVQGETLEELK